MRKTDGVTGNRGRRVTLKVKFATFGVISRSRSVPAAIGSRDELNRLAIRLLGGALPILAAIRLLGES